MNRKLLEALIFLLDAFGLDMSPLSRHKSIKAKVPRHKGQINCVPLGCIPLAEQLTGERLDQTQWNLWSDTLRVWLYFKKTQAKRVL